ncbi:helix-turn-helix domain-containing protein [Streptomyces sp. JCM17656]|nr:helix-turn-helix domain-containing protein [Streptomyces sp. JCM17656]
MCRSIYVYVLFRTKGPLVTQTSAVPLPPPEERRRLREAGALTQAQVAERMGVSRETVRAWESGRTTPRGRRRDAYAQLLWSIADKTGVRNPRKYMT